MGTALVFIGVGWTGTVYEPMALVVGSIVCIAAALQVRLVRISRRAISSARLPCISNWRCLWWAVSSLVIGFTVKYLDTPTSDLVAKGVQHAIGEKYNAPQATLMATLIKGLLSFNLDWQFVLAGCFISITMELCGIKALSFAVGLICRWPPRCQFS